MPRTDLESVSRAITVSILVAHISQAASPELCRLPTLQTAMAPIRRQRSQQKVIDEVDVLPYVRENGKVSQWSLDLCTTQSFTAAHITPCYSFYSKELCPLSAFKEVPDGLAAVAQPNGDIILCMQDNKEASFDVIGVVLNSCLNVPPGFPKYGVCFLSPNVFDLFSGQNSPFFAVG